ncbi:MAG: hypothetical protein CMH30_04655 [Micavibrio sp.]|nr:hypothetical protein [Micavibrio sp.]|tara:strand:- start:872 stop:1282 length:411 start_codon:yes stop_codon:yes gene_type:complete
MKKLILVALILLTAACSGTLQGQMQGGEAVTFNYEDTGFDSGTLSVTLPDGEFFQGKYVNKNSDSSGSAHVFGSGGSATVVTSETVRSGIIVATLFGNKGQTMKCSLTPSNASMGMVSSGVGDCLVSDGRKIDVIF